MENYSFLIEDMTFSFSRLNSYYTCPHMWKLSYIDCEKGQSNSFADFGTFCHKMLEEYARGEAEIFELASLYEEGYKKAVPLPFPPNKYVDLGEKYYEAGLEYLENFEGFGDYEIIEAEKKLEFSVGDYKVTGYIDLLLKDKEGNFHILDHKSSTVKSKTSEKAKEYWMQMYLYSMAIYDEFGVYPKQLHINAFKEGKMYVIDFDVNEVNKVKKWVFDTIDALKKESKFCPKSDYFFCNFICNFRDGTCKYKPSRY